MESNIAKNNHESELDEIKQEFYKFSKEKAKKYGHNSIHLECFPSEYNKEWIKFMQETKKKIDGMLDKVPPKDKLYLSLILIKAFCVIRILLGLKVTDPKKFIRTAESIFSKCETALKPYKNKAEGVWLHVMNQVVHVQYIDARNGHKTLRSECLVDSRKALKLLEDADKHYTDFVHYQMEKPWGIDEIFCCYDTKGNQLKSELADDFYKFREFTIKILLMEFSNKTDDEPKIRKYGIEGLRTFVQCPRHHENLHLLVRYAIDVVQPFTNIHYFVQAQHLIAVVMHTVVEFRRSLPEKARTTVNPIQYDASYLYAEFGSRLICKSHELSKDKYYQEHGLPIDNREEYYRSHGLPVDCPSFDFHHDDCVRLLPKSPMLKQYEKVYPTQMTLDPEVYKKMQKKTEQWLERMEELKRTSTAPPDLCLKPMQMIEQRKCTLVVSTLCPLFGDKS